MHFIGNKHLKRQQAQRCKIHRLERRVNTVEKKLQSQLNKCYNELKELNYAHLLHDTITNSSWLKDKAFSLHGWAANYSFIYMLYRILDNVKPQHILEMGMGQTSRITSQYIAHCNTSATLDIIENDAGWIATYQPQLASSNNINVHQCDLEFFTNEKCDCRKYKELEKIVRNIKYDFIIVDGPFGGGQTFPRSNIIDLIKNDNLADDFIIVFDDAERDGEKKTIDATLKLLNERRINFTTFRRNGIKTQQYITSASRAFIQYL